MDKVTVKPTWGLAWGMWWRLLLINLAFIAIIVGVAFGIGMLFWEQWFYPFGG